MNQKKDLEKIISTIEVDKFSLKLFFEKLFSFFRRK